LKKRRTPCKILVFKADPQGVRHDNCCSKITGCQAKE
jgi:hypothetical protein